MKKTSIIYLFAALLIFIASCKKEETTTPEDPGTINPAYSGINKVKLTIDGVTQEFVFPDVANPNLGLSAFGTKNTEYDSVYTEVDMGASNVFDHVSMAAMIITWFGEGTGTQDISYGLQDAGNLDNFTGSNLILVTDTASFPILYSLEQATANVTSYGDVGGFIEGTFNCSEVSLNDVPQPNVSISGTFKVQRYSDGK